MDVRQPREPNFWPRVSRGPGCWEWTGNRTRGYGQLSENGRLVRAHRLAWTLTFGPIAPGLYVLHHCDNPGCVRPDHLFLGTQFDNMRDASAKGRLRQQGRGAA